MHRPGGHSNKFPNLANARRCAPPLKTLSDFKKAYMQTYFKPYYKLLSVLILLICFLLFVSFGWSAFSTLTNRSGLNGNMYIYYDLSKPQYLFYTFVVSLLGLILGFIILYYRIRRNTRMLSVLIWYFLAFMALVIICEIYLNTRFVGKG